MRDIQSWALAGLLGAIAAPGCSGSKTDESSEAAEGGEGGDPDCYYQPTVTLTRADYETWVMGGQTPLDTGDTTGGGPDPTTGPATTTDTSTTDASTTDASTTATVMLSEQQVCENICGRLVLKDSPSTFLSCEVLGAMGDGDVHIECRWQIGCA